MTCELADRTRIRAFRVGPYVLIIAEGTLPTPGFTVDIAQSPLLIFPPQFNLLRCPLPGIWPQVVSPYRYAETVRFPQDQPSITVHHAEGSDEVAIEGWGDELAAYRRAVVGPEDESCPPGADVSTGFSKRLSFDEAFAAALAGLPPLDPSGADVLERVEVLEVGGLFGGIAGFHDLFVRICRTHD